jgi:hypothetical protein
MSFTPTLFSVANFLVLPLWASLVFFPRSRWTAWVFKSSHPILLLALFYTAVVIPAVLSDPSILSSLAQPTLPGVQALLGTPVGAAAGWIHFLCFDLFVGAQIRQSAIESRESFWWVSPVLILVLMVGPFGWLMYWVVHRFVSPRVS